MTEPASPPSPGPWHQVTVEEIRAETPTAKTFRLAFHEPPAYMAGQHFIIRLTAPDGYRAMRSYSAASPPAGDRYVELTVERLPEGEVSMYLHDEVQPGDQLEIRGPIGGWFVWSADTPALLVGGGSGVVPLMAMLRLARMKSAEDLVRLVVSVRDEDSLYYKDEVLGSRTSIVYTRSAPRSYPRPVGHIRVEDFDDLPGGSPEGLTAYICGSSRFADAATDLVAAVGVPLEKIRIERFGPSG